MKRVISAFLAMILLLGLCGCVGPKTPQGEPMEDSAQAVIDLVGMLPVGTMGVSLKAIESAVSLMQWCDASVLTADTVKAEVKAHYDTLEDFDKSMFSEQLHLITSTASAWQDETQKESDLRLVGLDPKQYDWSARAFELLHAITSAVNE